MTPVGFDKNSENTAFNPVFAKEAGKDGEKVQKPTWVVGRLSVPSPGFTNLESF
jgi:hypothetical protein